MCFRAAYQDRQTQETAAYLLRARSMNFDADPVTTWSSGRHTPLRINRRQKGEDQMDLIAQLEAEQIAALGKEIPDFKAGDTIRVGYKVTEGSRSRVQNYEGVCISRKNGEGIAGSFTVRKISFGEGVERVFPLYSTNIDSITVVRRGRVRRAKLYYLRSRRGKSARIAEDTTYKPKKA
jgi:large subunit ribosomal protein L19